MIQTFGFSFVIEGLKERRRFTRTGWNGKGMWIRKHQGYADTEFPVRETSENDMGIDSGTFYPFIGIHTADNIFIPWTPSQTDMMADDWYEVE